MTWQASTFAAMPKFSTAVTIPGGATYSGSITSVSALEAAIADKNIDVIQWDGSFTNSTRVLIDNNDTNTDQIRYITGSGDLPPMRFYNAEGWRILSMTFGAGHGGDGKTTRFDMVNAKDIIFDDIDRSWPGGDSFIEVWNLRNETTENLIVQRSRFTGTQSSAAEFMALIYKSRCSDAYNDDFGANGNWDAVSDGIKFLDNECHNIGDSVQFQWENPKYGSAVMANHYSTVDHRNFQVAGNLITADAGLAENALDFKASSLNWSTRGKVHHNIIQGFGESAGGGSDANGEGIVIHFGDHHLETYDNIIDGCDIGISCKPTDGKVEHNRNRISNSRVLAFVGETGWNAQPAPSPVDIDVNECLVDTAPKLIDNRQSGTTQTNWTFTNTAFRNVSALGDANAASITGSGNYFTGSALGNMTGTTSVSMPYVSTLAIPGDTLAVPDGIPSTHAWSDEGYDTGGGTGGTDFPAGVTVDAGTNQTFNALQATTITATITNTLGHTIAQAWTIESGPNTSISQITDALNPNTTFTPTAYGTYVLEMTVTEQGGDGTEVTDTLTLTYNAPAGGTGTATTAEWRELQPEDRTALESPGDTWWQEGTAQAGKTGTSYLIAMAWDASATSSTGGIARWSGNVPANTKVWLRGQAQDSTHDRVFVSYNNDSNNAESVQIGDPVTIENWTWASPSFTLPAGQVSIEIIVEKGGARVDKLILIAGTDVPTGEDGFTGGSLLDFDSTPVWNWPDGINIAPVSQTASVELNNTITVSAILTDTTDDAYLASIFVGSSSGDTANAWPDPATLTSTVLNATQTRYDIDVSGVAVGNLGYITFHVLQNQGGNGLISADPITVSVVNPGAATWPDGVAVDVGGDRSVNDSGSITVNAAVTNSNGFSLSGIWSYSGSGSVEIVNPNSSNTVINGLSAGSGTLTYSVDTTPATQVISDSLTLTINDTTATGDFDTTVKATVGVDRTTYPGVVLKCKCGVTDNPQQYNIAYQWTHDFPPTINAVFTDPNAPETDLIVYGPDLTTEQLNTITCTLTEL